MNWERRDKCNQCGAPKPGQSKEVRSGRGGGFNERQPESDRKSKREDSDDEYDDLGRRKKKKGYIFHKT